jgi:hypothetical protein
MEPKKDVSTAILDQKKAPNKLLVMLFLSRLKRPSTTKIHQFNSARPRCPNSKFSKEMPSSSRAKRENKHLWSPWSITSLKKEKYV